MLNLPLARDSEARGPASTQRLTAYGSAITYAAPALCYAFQIPVSTNLSEKLSDDINLGGPRSRAVKITFQRRGRGAGATDNQVME